MLCGGVGSRMARRGRRCRSGAFGDRRLFCAATRITVSPNQRPVVAQCRLSYRACRSATGYRDFVQRRRRLHDRRRALRARWPSCGDAAGRSPADRASSYRCGPGKPALVARPHDARIARTATRRSPGHRTYCADDAGAGAAPAYAGGGSWSRWMAVRSFGQADGQRHQCHARRTRTALDLGVAGRLRGHVTHKFCHTLQADRRGVADRLSHALAYDDRWREAPAFARTHFRHCAGAWL